VTYLSILIQICEQMPGHWKKDIDYIKPGYPFTIRWSNVFIDAADIIDRFNIYLSTFPGGESIYFIKLTFRICISCNR
jgi:hypothetical protein